MAKILCLALVLFFLCTPSVVLAQSTPGITVTPAVVQIDLAHDPDNFTLSYANTTASTLQINFSAKDFSGLEEDWRIKFLSQPDALNYRYSLSSWLQFNPPTMLLKPNETGILTVTIRKNALPAGGHYASIMADIYPSPPSDGAIAIKSQLVSLAFVRAYTGFETESAKIIGFAYTPPTGFIVRFENTGNTELTPYGLVTLTDPANHEVTRGILNEDSLITLPESIRRYTVSTDLNSKNWSLPGLYTATISLHFGNDHSQTTSTKFFYFGGLYTKIISVGLLAFLIIGGFIILFKMKRR